MKYKHWLVAFITFLICLTEVAWKDTYISVHGDLLIMGDNIIRAVKWFMWGSVCIRIIKYPEKETKEKNKETNVPS